MPTATAAAADTPLLRLTLAVGTAASAVDLEAALTQWALAAESVQTLTPDEHAAVTDPVFHAALSAAMRSTHIRRLAISAQARTKALLRATAKAEAKRGPLRLVGPGEVADVAGRLAREWGLDAQHAQVAAERMADGCPEGVAVLPHAVKTPTGTWRAARGPERFENLEWLCQRWGVALNSRSGIPCRVTVDPSTNVPQEEQLTPTAISAARFAWAKEHGVDEPIGETHSALEYVASRREYDPVKLYLDKLPPWDRKPRLATWLQTYCGAGPAPAQAVDSHLAELGMCWLISAVARVFEPGCKADGVLVLAGAMGAGKSELFKALFGREYHSEDKITPGERDAIQVMRRVWVYELAELAVARSTDMRDLRRWVSQETETTRFAYGRLPETVPRRCVFAATVNPEANRRLVDDPAGKRRWWLVACERPLDPDAVRRDRDQIWAEALFLYKAGTPHWISKTAESENERRHEAIDSAQFSHPWLDTLFLHLEALAAEGRTPDCLSTGEVLELMGVPMERRHEKNASVAAQCLRALGWLPYPHGHRPKGPLRYYRPDSDDGAKIAALCGSKA